MDDYDYYRWGFHAYVPAAERRRRAALEMEQRQRQGQTITPVQIVGRLIAKTFWGRAWCENLERYSDIRNRLARGRTYVRNGSVVHLEIEPGSIEACVSGSELYEVKLTVAPLPQAIWKDICEDCAGSIDSLVELLQGRFSKGVMERICRMNDGLFPAPAEIKLSCSCPDRAYMCKHVAAVLYGIGSRFDTQPELIFRLREVDEADLIAKVSHGVPLEREALTSSKILAGEDLAEMFGLDMAEIVETVKPARTAPRKKAARKKARRKS